LRPLSNLIEQCAQVVGAIVQRLRLEITGRIVEGGVDLLAGRKMLLRRCEIGGGVLQRKQILPNSLTQGDIRHGTNTYLDQLTLAGICTLLPLMMRKAIPASFGGASGRLILGRFAGPRVSPIEPSCEAFADSPADCSRRRSPAVASTTRRNCGGEYDEAVADCLCLDTTLRSFNARAGLLTEL
jgi:hypothetical protein